MRDTIGVTYNKCKEELRMRKHRDQLLRLCTVLKPTRVCALVRELRGAVGEAAAEEDARGRRARQLRRQEEQRAQQLEDERVRVRVRRGHLRSDGCRCSCSCS